MIIRSILRTEWSYDAQYSEILVFGYRAVRDVDIFGQDVDMVEEILVDAEIAALLFGRADRVELVEAEYRHVAEADDALLVAFHQLAVQPQRRAARS